MLRQFLAAAILLLASPGPSPAQAQSPDSKKEKEQLEYLKAHYTKHEYRIPMRDGKRLFTAVYVPKDSAQKYPILLHRTPYSCKPYGVDQYPASLGPSDLFVKAGYIFAEQDVRGRWMSEGQFVDMRPEQDHTDKAAVDESTDAWDTIDWLVKKVPGHNGKAGMYGTSYPGFYTAAGMIDAHPALKAVSPQAPVTDWFMGDDWHHNGALFLPHLFNFMAGNGRPRPEPTKKFEHKFDHGTPDGYKFFLHLGRWPGSMPSTSRRRSRSGTRS
jgi:predicted acyl esterase